VRATLAYSDTPFLLLIMLLDEKQLLEFGVSILKGDYFYGDDIVACAGSAFGRGDLSLASLTAVYHIHASRVDPTEVLLPDVASAVLLIAAQSALSF
jgi:hypothetical protein